MTETPDPDYDTLAGQEAESRRDAAAPARIRWEPTPYGTVAGYAGSLGPQVFHLWQSPCDHGDVALGEWELSAQFPASRDERWRAHGPDPGKLKAEAEEWLKRFVGSLGASFEAVPTHPEEESKR